MKFYRFALLALSLVTLAGAPLAYAAELSVLVSKVPKAGESVAVTIALDTKGDIVNGLEGTLSYSREHLRLTGIRSGNSLVNFWLESPAETRDGIRFAGITPGGYTGQSGEVFSLTFDVLQTGDARFNLQGARALANDGEGTPLPLTLVGVARVEPTLSNTRSDADTVLPEEFSVTRSQSPDLFDGKPFLVFHTQDKHSGIAYYEVAEGNWVKYPDFLMGLLTFERASSPYEIRTESSMSYMYVRAVDSAGNARISILSPETVFIPEGKYLLLGILVVLALLGARYLRHVRRSQK